MSGRMIWHDSRLLGKAPSIAANTYVVDATVSIDHAIGWIAYFAKSQGTLDELLIMCHGYEADFNLKNQTCTGEPHGGFGLSICDKGLTMGTVSKLSLWYVTTPLINKITIYACAPADVGPGNRGTSADGMKLMSLIAKTTGAIVVAARDTQTYTHLENPSTKETIHAIDFGVWEGPVFEFNSSNGAPTPTSPGPMR